MEIDLIVITNFKEEQDSRGKFGRIAKQLRRREAGQGQTKMLKCKTMTF